MSGALGLTMGPVVATILKRWFGYVETLGIFALLILTVGLIAVSQIPKHVNKDSSSSAEKRGSTEQ